MVVFCLSLSTFIGQYAPCKQIFSVLLTRDKKKYIGQAAHMMIDPTVYANPFYLTVPPGMLWPSLIVAILACIVASQAVITGSFQVCHNIPFSNDELGEFLLTTKIRFYHKS